MNLQDINLNHLFYFHEISQEGSLSKAAKKLQVSQPTLSQQLKAFEKSLGVTLFNRVGRSLELTQKGQYLYSKSYPIFKNIEKVMTGFSYRLNMTTKERVSIGMTPLISKEYAAHVLCCLICDPKIGVSTIESSYLELVSKLKTHDLDFFISKEVEEKKLEKGLKQVSLGCYKYFFVCGNKFDYQVNNIPQDLANKPYFKFSGSNPLQLAIDKYLLDNNTVPNVVGESDNLEIIMAGTEVDSCFSVLPEFSVKELLKSQRLKKLGTLANLEIKLVGVYRKDQSERSVEDTLYKLKEHINSML